MKQRILMTFDKKDFSLLCFEKGTLYVDGEGGQLGDRGKIDGNKILQVKRVDGYPCAVIEKKNNYSTGEFVELELDLERRVDIAQQHTAQHLLSAVALRELDAETVGFQMGEEFSTIDLTIGLLEDKMKRLLEDVSNDCILKLLPVTVKEVDPSEIFRYNLRKSVSDKILEKAEKIRLVKIEGIDVSPCGGFHVKNTGEVGLLKILKVEKVKGNLTRVYFVAGKRAIRVFQNEHSILGSLGKLLTCGYHELVSRTQSILEDLKIMNNRIKGYVERIAKETANNLSENSSELLLYEDDEEILSMIPRFLDKECYIFFGKAGEKIILASKGYDLTILVKELKSRFDIKGGAGKTRGQFVYSKELDELIEFTLHWMKGEKS
ncbi:MULTISPECIES: alanyl-tRNA editing protein [Kosmotoga]|uniref:Threonyl/alanyl tRNA synthetase SAD n=1 Tax=Kosmotoga olearia (strain ATCC BAA-1733 / DSM 21960 / TBF 19.5.1) TaxID=521045 RepID=C5CEG4_KOSOT|nr:MULTISPECIES: alanyl-tRNA editing protein [Kosmotoga]ACR80204.1 Threonyl/alanyl tRNA synthetase SAD [Kosmotoga olearia TBF 19.5.1]MDK2952946.1 alanyl-tRNA synthetase [Kosmotoga sp.]